MMVYVATKVSYPTVLATADPIVLGAGDTISYLGNCRTRQNRSDRIFCDMVV